MFSLWDCLAKTALVWRQQAGKPKLELKALAGLACVISGVFLSLQVLGQLVEIPSVGGLCLGMLKAVCLHAPIMQSLLVRYGFHVTRADMGWMSRQQGALSLGWTAGLKGAAPQH